MVVEKLLYEGLLEFLMELTSVRRPVFQVMGLSSVGRPVFQVMEIFEELLFVSRTASLVMQVEFLTKGLVSFYFEVGCPCWKSFQVTLLACFLRSLDGISSKISGCGGSLGQIHLL